MSKFGQIFGIKQEEVKKNCLLLPCLPKGILTELGINDLCRGKLYSSASSPDFTLIHTGIGAGLVGDAVLYLKKTVCRNLILFGSCGLLKQKSGLGIGSLVAPARSYSYDSFIQMLLEKDKKPKSFFAHPALLQKLLKANPEIQKVNCATLASLKLEEEMTGMLFSQGIAVVEMECSAFFAAAAFTGLKAVALLYVSDIVKQKPFYAELEPALKTRQLRAINNSCATLCQFTKRNLSG